MTKQFESEIESHGGVFLTQSNGASVAELVKQIESRRNHDSAGKQQGRNIGRTGMVDAGIGSGDSDLAALGLEVEAMTNLTLSPALGWPLGTAICVIMLVCAVAQIVLHIRRRSQSDETVWACARRSMICALVAIMALTPSIVSSTNSRAINTTDVVVAVDVTGSMAVADAQYGSDEQLSRLDVAKAGGEGIAAMYPNSSFAALRFGASGTLDVPLTPDSKAIDNWADTLAPESTSISAGSTLDVPIDSCCSHASRSPISIPMMRSCCT